MGPWVKEYRFNVKCPDFNNCIVAMFLGDTQKIFRGQGHDVSICKRYIYVYMMNGEYI